MLTLAMDTAYKYLVAGLYEDGELLAGVAQEAFKKQSETIFVALNDLFEKTGRTLKEVKEVVITEGPGSYTGMRIAMTIAKMVCTQSDAKLYVISTMQLYAGLEEDANVLLDARGHRAYTAHLHKGEVEILEILDTDDVPAFLQAHPGTLFGDGFLAGQEAAASDFLKNFGALKEQYRLIENVHGLIPLYLKESSSYKV